MKIAVINSSGQQYNYATHKMVNLFTRQGHEVRFSKAFAPRRGGADMWARQCDKAYLSAIFTFDLPVLVQDALNLISSGVEVEIGGPAATAMPEYILGKTGIQPHIGLDERFEHIPGDDYQAVFTSRGCPRKCGFCLVQKLEGQRIIEYDDFPIPNGKNPFICDNNILATSWKHQTMVVDKLKGVKDLDLNSGFDDRIFIKNPEKYWRLYNELDIEAWRFAYDSPEQKEAINAIAGFLHSKGVNYRRIIVFCLLGYEGQTLEEGIEKLTYLIDIGTSPYPMRYKPLDSVDKNYTPPGWDKGQLDRVFNWAGVPKIWRTTTWEEFKRK